MRNLQRSRGSGREARSKCSVIHINERGLTSPLLQHGVVFPQQFRTPLFGWKHECVPTALKSFGKRIQTAFTEHKVAVRKPYPVRPRVECGVIPTDTPPEKLFFAIRHPVPGHIGNLHLPEIGQKTAGTLIIRAVADGHGDVQVRRREMHQRTELIGQKVGIVPAMAHHLEFKLALVRPPLLGQWQIRLEPTCRNPPLGRQAVEPKSKIGYQRIDLSGLHRNSRRLFKVRTKQSGDVSTLSRQETAQARSSAPHGKHC